MADMLAEAASIDYADHLAHHPCSPCADRDLGMKAGRWRRLRGRADDDRREIEQIVGLDDDRQSSPVLGVSTSTRERDLMDVTAYHATAP